MLLLVVLAEVTEAKAGRGGDGLVVDLDGARLVVALDEAVGVGVDDVRRLHLAAPCQMSTGAPFFDGSKRTVTFSPTRAASTS